MKEFEGAVSGVAGVRFCCVCPWMAACRGEEADVDPSVLPGPGEGNCEACCVCCGANA